MAGLVAVAVASLAAGFAATRGELIAARAAQGLGAAFISPAALSIVATLFTDGAERNKALGVWGAVTGAGGAAGVLLGGVLTSGLSWKWVLWVNVPVTLIALLLTPGLVPESRSEDSTRHFDSAGAVTITSRALADGLRAPGRRNRRLGLDQDHRPARGVSRPDRGIRRDRAPIERAARSVPDLPVADAHRRQRRGAPARSVTVLDVLLHHPVHAAGAALQPDPRRPVLPAACADDHRRGRGGRPASHALRLQADPGRRAWR